MSHRDRRRTALNAEINVTSLVDVAFTLLIIFIIAAPIMQGGIEVDLPKAEVAPLTVNDVVIVSIDREGAMYVDNVPVASLEELREVFPRVAQEKGATNAAVKTDSVVPSGALVRVLGALNALEVGTVGIVAEPDPRR